MMLSRLLSRSLPVVTLVAAASACTGDSKTPDQRAADSAMATSLEIAKGQKKFIDSVISSAPSVQAVAKAKGKLYDVADDSLAAIVRRESAKTYDCYTNALRDYPGLAGKVTMLVNFGAAGWDLVRVEDQTWSGPAGGIVQSCINFRAKKEWNLPIHNVKPGAHLVQLEFRPESVKTAPPPKTATKSKQ